MIPKLILDSWQRVNKRIDEFCGGDSTNSFKMLFITDVHVGLENAHHIHQLRYVGELLKLNPVDLVVNGGDIGLDVGEDLIEAQRVLDITEKATQYDVPYFYCKGNHDHKPAIFNDYKLMLKLNKCFMNIDPSIGKIVLDENKSSGYGYYIDKKTDTKIIFLNTCDNLRGFDLSNEQLEFVIKTLEENEQSNVILVGHYCLNECGGWKEYPYEDKFSTKTIRQIEKDFVNKTSGNAESLKWDFTNAKGNIAIHLAGDSHFNNQSTSDGFLIACRQGYGGVDSWNIADGGSFDTFDKHELCNFDILVINNKQQKKLFRVGAGEEIRDIDF